MIEKSRREYLIVRIRKNSVPKNSGCIEWTGQKNNRGYGLIHFAAKSGDGYKSSMPASRACYMAFFNVILERNQFVCHTCDNPICVNINHLFLGTPKDNTQDMITKGRRAKKHRYHHRERKYTSEQIEEAIGAVGLLKDIAPKYGMSLSYLSKLRRNIQKKQIVG